MASRTPSKGPTDYLAATSRECPKCGAHVARVPRRFMDRLMSLFFPNRRYRCRNFSCDWEGTLRKKAGAPRGSEITEP